MNQIPTARQLCQVHQLGELSLPLHNPELPVNPPLIVQPSLESPAATMYIGGGMPPIPTKLVKRIQEGQFVEMAELSPDTLKNPSYQMNPRTKDPSFTKLLIL